MSRWLAVFACCALVGSLGCAKTRQARRVETSGFLDNYSQLEKGKGTEALLVYRNPEAKFSDYEKVFVEPVVIWKGKESKELPADDAQALAGFLHKAMVDHLKEDYQIVDGSGQGVLRVRATITEASKSHVILDSLTTIAPQTRLLTTGTQFAAGTGALIGKTTVEGEILDGESGKRLLAAVDRRYGTKALRGVFKSWDDVESAFQYWGERLRDRLREERKKEKEGPPQ